MISRRGTEGALCAGASVVDDASRVLVSGTVRDDGLCGRDGSDKDVADDDDDATLDKSTLGACAIIACGELFERSCLT